VSHHFFFSYARADSSPLVKRFFDDLCDTIRIRSGLLRSEVVGFYEETENKPGIEWSAGSAEALRNSHTMVSLLSPAYFHGEHAGKEWQIFEMRRRQAFNNSEIEGKKSESLAEIIAPVIWIPWQGPIPRVVNEMLSHPGCIYQKRAVTMMLRSADRSLAEYAELVKLLANKIVEVARRTSLPPAESLPTMKEVHNPFHIWDEPLVVPNDLNQSDRYGRSHPNGEFVHTLAAQIVDSAGSVNARRASAVTDDVSYRNFAQDNPGSGSTTEPKQVKKYSVFVIDNEEQVLRLIEECCLISGLFDVRTYRDAEMAFRDLRLRSFYGDETPDLFLIDLGEDMQGLEVIKALQEQSKITPSIIALSGLASDNIDETAEAGAVAIIAKPFNTAELIDQMVRCAEIGSKSLVDAPDGAADLPPDDSRRWRPVFLSFCTEDIQRANFLKRNLEARGIGVWFSPDAEEPGEDWRERIRKGISNACVFVALFTDKYEKSGVCLAELTDLVRRLPKSALESPILIPVLYNFQPAELQDKLINHCLKKYHYITISSGKFLDGFTTLLGRIQNVVNRDPCHRKSSLSLS
jgi:CheY-like chemotaxis protein